MIYNNNKSGDKEKAREYVEYEITCTSPCIAPENEGNKKPNVGTIVSITIPYKFPVYPKPETWLLQEFDMQFMSSHKQLL